MNLSIRFRKDNFTIIALSIVGVVALFGMLQLFLKIDASLFSNSASLKDALSYAQIIFQNNIVFFYAMFLIIPTTLILQAWIPADPQQKLWSSNVTQDAVWLVLLKTFNITFYVWYLNLLIGLYNQHLAFLTIDALKSLPEAIRLLSGILVMDFLAWFHHLVRHHVPWFWYFHQVHHSQKELNLFTDFRVHFIDLLIARTIIVLPLFILDYEVIEIFMFLLFSMVFTRFYHGNIKTNLGLLKYIFVTPQSHRIHHSLEKKHQDKNFGVFFCIWDRLFGTFMDDGTYPPTGIKDPLFPFLEDKGIKAIMGNMVLQVIYPFRKISRSILGSDRSLPTLETSSTYDSHLG